MKIKQSIKKKKYTKHEQQCIALSFIVSQLASINHMEKKEIKQNYKFRKQSKTLMKPIKNGIKTI